MRFFVRKLQDDDSEGGELWRVLDGYALREIARTKTESDAQLVADALEYLSLHAICGEFDIALARAEAA